MAVYKKLTAKEIAGFRTSPKQLNPFWRSYFEKITLDLNKQFFSYYKQFPKIHFINRQVARVEDFLEDLDGTIRLYQILPHGSVGILHFPKQLVESLIEQTLGGKKINSNEINKPGKVGTTFIHTIMEKVILTMSLFFEEQSRQLELVIISPNSNDLILHGLNKDEILSIQQFAISVGDQMFYFELALSNQLLESFQLI